MEALSVHGRWAMGDVHGCMCQKRSFQLLLLLSPLLRALGKEPSPNIEQSSTNDLLRSTWRKQGLLCCIGKQSLEQFLVWDYNSQNAPACVATGDDLFHALGKMMWLPSDAGKRERRATAR